MRSASVHSISRACGSGQQDINVIVRRIADTVHKLNEQIEAAVKAGVTVELVRVSRCHNGSGQWGDQMAPVIRMPENEDRWE